MKRSTKERTYNLVNPDYAKMHDIIGAMADSLRVKGFYLMTETKALEPGNMVEKRARKLTEPFWPYTLISDPVWSMQNTLSAIGDYRPDRVSKTFSFYMQKFIEKRVIHG
jgi:hypothetical protein